MRLLAPLALLASLGCVRGDLPVDCRHHQILGRWVFELGPETADKSVVCHSGEAMTVSCYGSEFTDADLGMKCNFAKTRTFEVELKEPNIAEAVIDGTAVTGTWTSVYNEAFDIKLAGRSYLSFSLFDQNAEHAATRNHCQQTWPGRSMNLATPDDSKWGCFVAYRKGTSKSVCSGGFDAQGTASGDGATSFLELATATGAKALAAAAAKAKAAAKVKAAAKAKADNAMYQTDVRFGCVVYSSADMLESVLACWLQAGEVEQQHACSVYQRLRFFRRTPVRGRCQCLSLLRRTAEAADCCDGRER